MPNTEKFAEMNGSPNDFTQLKGAVEHIDMIVGVVRRVEEVPRGIASDGQARVHCFVGRVVHRDHRLVGVHARCPAADRAVQGRKNESRGVALNLEIRLRSVENDSRRCARAV